MVLEEGLERHNSKTLPHSKMRCNIEKKDRDVDFTAKFAEERKGKRANMMLMD